MCQVAEGPFLKSWFPSLLRRVDMNIEIGSINDFPITHDDLLIQHLYLLIHKNTRQRGVVALAWHCRTNSFEKQPLNKIKSIFNDKMHQKSCQFERENSDYTFFFALPI